MRGPRWGRIVAGILLIVLIGVPSLVGAIVALAGSTYFQRKDAVAEGRAPGTLTFEAENQRYTVALSAKPDGVLFDGLSRTERRAKYRVREGEATEARCVVAHPDGSTTRLRGDRQTVGETVATSYVSVGRFDGQAGRTSVECHFDPAEDLIGTPTETPLMVHATGSTLRTVGYVLFALTFVVAGGGTLLILWGTVWRGPRPA